MAEAVTWDQALEAFLERCHGDGHSPKTIENYQRLLAGGRTVAFRESHGVRGPADLTADALEALKSEYRAAGLAPNSVHAHWRSWRRFARFCFDKGWLTSDAIFQVKGPRLPRLTPATFTADDERTLLAACRYDRDRFIVRFTIETGLRRGEVARMTVSDIHKTSSGTLIRVRQGKGAKDRGVPISEAFDKELTAYVAEVRPTTSCEALFVSHKPSPHGDFEPMSDAALYMVWRRLRVATGIRAYPHKARHTFATRAAQDGVAPWAIQGALGHASLAMTERYVDAAAVDLSSAFARREQHQAPEHHAPETPPADPSPIHELARQLIDALADQADPPRKFAPILVADFLHRGASTSPTRRGPLPPWFTTPDDPSSDRMWLQQLYMVFCAVANHLELPRHSGPLVERYGLPEDMLTALLEVAMHATVELPEDVVGEQAVEDTIAVVRGALQEATAARKV
jgi:integrase